MHVPVTHELRLLQPWDETEYPLLLAVAQIGLEADQVIERPGQVVLPQLHHRVGPLPRARVGQADGAERPEGQRLPPARRQHLHRQAALKETGILPLEAVQRDTLRRHQRFHETVVLLLRQRAVDVVGITPPITGSPKRDGHINRIGGHDGSQRVVEVQVLLARQRGDTLRQRVGGEGAGGDDGRAIGDRRHLLPHHADVRVGLDAASDLGGEQFPVHRQRTAGWHARTIGAGQHQRVQMP